ncbi:hypothetical protein GGR42_001500 [Saonia flava]|uniref:Glycoside hydrolase family 2 catalytic domain-containing protein n=1 Tax=Saonia flava TaxID=523696 RepID=A0A846QSK3_9FLAO|nr:glycoside hydrolase family 2 TIM barrel-domain containing protein [Saonia flava]NJB71038.1 hypothetical protein [Saonia flava]
MSKRINRNIYRSLLILSFLGINGLILFGLSTTLSYLNSGADRSSMLHLEANLDESYLPKMNWDRAKNLGRPIGDQTLMEIEKDYLSAWHVRNMAYKSNDPFGIHDYYTDSARVKLFDIINLNKANDIELNTTTLAHNPKIEFYSTDGTLVVISDNNVTSYEEIYKADKLLVKQRDTTNYQIMMLLEDGFWRIRHLEINSKELETVQLETQDSINRVEDINSIKGVNYYPKDSPWDMFGKKFNDSIIDADYKLIKSMGLNTIRIFIQYEDFGKANVLKEKLDKLKVALDLAQENNINVIVTLFDFYGNYDVSDWTITDRHAEQIVTIFKDHKAIIAWDIKNEPDLDFDSRGKEMILAWLENMILNIKNWDKNHPVTIGWSSPQAAINLSKEVDFVSFHYYQDLNAFEYAMDNLKLEIPNKPIVLQEYGISSYSGIWNLYKGSEKKQAAYYEQIQKVIKEKNIPYVFWTLFDFEEVPVDVAGRLPWRTKKQHYFGCIDKKGNKKAYFKHLK